MSDIQFQPLWGDPPVQERKDSPRSRLNLALDAFVALMRTAPGRWAELSSVNDEGHPQSRVQIMKKRYPDIEIQSRAVAGVKNRRRIWVRVRVDVPDVIASNGDRINERRERAAAAADA